MFGLLVLTVSVQLLGQGADARLLRAVAAGKGNFSKHAVFT